MQIRYERQGGSGPSWWFFVGLVAVIACVGSLFGCPAYLVQRGVAKTRNAAKRLMAGGAVKARKVHRDSFGFVFCSESRKLANPRSVLVADPEGEVWFTVPDRRFSKRDIQVIGMRLEEP